VELTTAEDDRTVVLHAARQLAPELSVRAAEGEAARSMPVDLAARVKAAGLFRLLLPRSLGGFELDPLTVVEVAELLSQADGSAGWTVVIGNATAFFAWLEPDVARSMIGDDPNFCSTSMFGPLGRATPDGAAGYSLSGRWPFNSGCLHSEWLQVGVLAMDGTSPARRPDGGPDWRLAFLPAGEGVIEETWDALGLRGTGSHHLRVDGARVPAERIAAPFAAPGRARHDGPLWRLSLFDLAAVMMAGFPFGVTRRFLDEFALLARGKYRGDPADTVAGSAHVQVLLSQAEARVRAARLYVHDVVGRVWETCLGGDEPGPAQQAELLLAGCHAMRTGLEAVDSLYRLAGAEAVYAGHPLERCFRDLHTASAHILLSEKRERELAQLLLGAGG
jgi:alkylation response protein AidB-like acyl-CoA dehydrogenase